MNRGSVTGLLAGLMLGACMIPASGAYAAPAAAETQTEPGQAQAALAARYKAMERSLRPSFGRVALPSAKASLELGDAYYFLDASDAKRVLTEAWGNPPAAVENVLGLVLPVGKSFHDETWGAVVQYEETGHIADADAAEQDYDAVLKDMQAAAEEENAELVQQGYPASQVVGWAQAPTYDAAAKTLIWARNIRFDGSPQNTLNYDVRTLGRTGVLSLNMVDVMPRLAVVKSDADRLARTVKFDVGARYADFDPATDATADYGLAGLVAAGAGLGAAKKFGLLALIAAFGKKAIGLVLALALGAGVWLKRRVGGGYREEEGGQG